MMVLMKGARIMVKQKGDHGVKGSGIYHPKESEGRHNSGTKVAAAPERDVPSFSSMICNPEFTG